MLQMGTLLVQCSGLQDLIVQTDKDILLLLYKDPSLFKENKLVLIN